MSFRSVAGLACAAAVVLAPAAHADTAKICALPYGSLVPAALRHWQCVGGSTQKPGCIGAAVYDPSTGYPLAGVDLCGLL